MKGIFSILLICSLTFTMVTCKEDTLRTYFDVIDLNHDGKISIAEFAKYLLDFIDEKNERNIKMAHLGAKQILNNKEMTLKKFEKIYKKLKEPEDDAEPQQIHLSVTGNPTEMIIMWATKSKKKLSN